MARSHTPLTRGKGLLVHTVSERIQSTTILTTRRSMRSKQSLMAGSSIWRAIRDAMGSQAIEGENDDILSALEPNGSGYGTHEPVW